jgi:hypothetical protein
MISKASAGYLLPGLFVSGAGISSVFDYSTHFTAQSNPGTALPSLSVRENLRTGIFNIVNKTNLVHNLFVVYLSICTCFGRLCARH